MSRGKRGFGSVYLRGRIYWIAYWRNAQQFHESSKSEDPDEATDLLKRRLAEVVTGKFAGLVPGRVTIGNLLELLIDDYRENERRSLDTTKLRIEAHVRPFFGAMRAADLSTSHVKEYIRERRAAGHPNSTINRELSILRRAQQLGVQHDPPLINHAVYIPKLKENNTRNGFVDEEQYRALLSELPEYLKLLLVVAYHTGVRKGELLRLRVNQIDLKNNQIRLHAGETKNDEGRVLPIYGEMRAALADALDKRRLEAKSTGEFPGMWLFRGEGGKRIRDFYHGWDSACERAGVPGQLFHDLRRSAVRNMERAGISRSVAMKISGHKTESVYRRYAIVSEQDIAEAGRKLEQNSSRTVTKTVTVRSNGRKARRA